LVLAGARVAERDLFPFQISYAIYAGVNCGYQANRFMVNAEYGAQLHLRAFLRPLGQSPDGLILYVGLCQTEFQVTGHDRVDVKHRSAGTGNPYAGFDEAGAGNGLSGTAPAFDPTWEGLRGKIPRPTQPTVFQFYRYKSNIQTIFKIDIYNFVYNICNFERMNFLQIIFRYLRF
jgi:hypothetical protein